MSRVTKIIIGLGVVVVVLIGGFLALPSFVGLERAEVSELAVGDRAAESIDAVLLRGQDEVAEQAPEAVEVVAELEVDTIEGVWQIAGDSVAGYRVFKDFVGAGEFEAVGRTSSVFGDLTIEGTAVTEAQFSVDIATIVSDDDRRDREFRGPILDAAQFPFANFTLTSPIDLGSVPQNGDEVAVDATGELTLKGVTNEVEFPLTARLFNGEVQVAGSIDIAFASYDIEPPDTPIIVVRDEGVIEFSLFFEMPDSA